MTFCLAVAFTFGFAAFIAPAGTIKAILAVIGFFFLSLAVGMRFQKVPVPNTPCSFRLFPVKLDQYPAVEWMACLKIDWATIAERNYSEMIIIGEVRCARCSKPVNIAMRGKKAFLRCEDCAVETAVSDYSSIRKEALVRAIRLAETKYKEYVEQVLHEIG